METSSNETRNVANLLASQTELVSTELNITNDRITNLEKTLLNLQKQYSSYKIRIATQTAINTLNDHINKHEIDTDTITNAILFATKGIIHPRFLNPEIIGNSIITIRNTFVDLSFPINESDSILQLFDATEISILFQNSHLIYYVKVPLLNPQKYSLVKALPLPVTQRAINLTNTFAYILPTFPLFAINLASRSFIPMNDVSLAKCKTLGNLYICQNIEATYEATSDIPCEVTLALSQTLPSLTKCNVKITQLHRTFWSRLHTQNSWIFSAPISEPIFINCPKIGLISTHLSHTGTLHLDPGCTAHTNNARFAASQTVTSLYPTTVFASSKISLSESIRAFFNLTNSSLLLNSELKNSLINTPYSPHATQEAILNGSLSLHEIAQKSREISSYKALDNKIESTHFLTTSSGISTITILLILIAAIAAWKFFPSSYLQHRQNQNIDIANDNRSILLELRDLANIQHQENNT